MERVTFKSLRNLVEAMNNGYTLTLSVFPNMYGYGISDSDRYNADIFQGSARECMAFLKGMTQGFGVVVNN